ncbi:MAG: xanthine/uracil/vitamin C permease (AzgA family) [Halioglobus sp.]|jgi:xanthine/uracil/vitamin C permease (AzgA family)
MGEVHYRDLVSSPPSIAPTLLKLDIAGALVYVALLMMGGMCELDWDDATELVPALLTVIMIPLSFSTANRIAVASLAMWRSRSLLPVPARLVLVPGFLR